MRFDLFHELPNVPALARSDADTVSAWLDEAAFADRLGFGATWLVEHHAKAAYSHCTKPELLLAAAAMRTRNLRLGFGVVPLPLHHPLHVAERVATLEALAGPRIEVGIGRGFAPDEYAAFGVEMADSREITAESLAVLRQAWSTGQVSFSGRHHRIEDWRVLPARQGPSPPLWTAAVSPSTFEWAAREGIGVLVGPFKPWFMVRRDIDRYRAAWRGPGEPRIGLTVGMVCLDDAGRARTLARDALTWFYRELYRVTLPVLERLYPGYEEIRDLGRFRHVLRMGIDLGFLETFGLAVVGDPAACIRSVQRYADAGVTHLLCAIGAGALPGAIVQESMACIAAHLMPVFALPGTAGHPGAACASS